MKNRLLIVLLVVASGIGCSAFDNSSKVASQPAPSVNPDVSGGGGENLYQGFYVGKQVVESESCEGVDTEPGEEMDFSMDVLQSGDIVNFQFEDGTNVSGTLVGDRATALFQGEAESTIFDFTFSEEGVTGTISIVQSTTDIQQANACSVSQVELSKGEKPEGWGESSSEETSGTTK